MRKIIRKIKQFFYEIKIGCQTKHSLTDQIAKQQLEIQELEWSKKYWKESAKAHLRTAEEFCLKLDTAQTKLKTLTEKK